MRWSRRSPHSRRVHERTRGARERDAGAARLPIDRAFAMRGFGAVVTGTLQSGVIRVEDELELLPAGRRVRVRGVQMHGDKVREASSGHRVAVNLSDIDATAIARGDTLVTPGAFEPSRAGRCHVGAAGRCASADAWHARPRPSRHARSPGARGGGGSDVSGHAVAAGWTAESRSRRRPCRRAAAPAPGCGSSHHWS